MDIGTEKATNGISMGLRATCAFLLLAIASSSPAQSPTYVKFEGNAPLVRPYQVDLVFWGTQAPFDGGGLESAQGFFNTMLGVDAGPGVSACATCLDALAEYNLQNRLVVDGYAQNGVVSASIVDTSSVTKMSSVSDSQVQAEIKTLLGSSLPPLTASNNTMVFIFMPSSVTFSDPFGKSSCGGSGVCGYHSFGTANVGESTFQYSYAVIADCGTDLCLPHDAGTEFDRVTVTASHELAEILTDPVPNLGNDQIPQGWAAPEEIGDLCESGPLLKGTGTSIAGGTYMVQDVYSDAAESCVPLDTGVEQKGPPPIYQTEVSYTASGARSSLELLGTDFAGGSQSFASANTGAATALVTGYFGGPGDCVNHQPTGIGDFALYNQPTGLVDFWGIKTVGGNQTFVNLGNEAGLGPNVTNLISGTFLSNDETSLFAWSQATRTGQLVQVGGAKGLRAAPPTQNLAASGAPYTGAFGYTAVASGQFSGNTCSDLALYYTGTSPPTLLILQNTGCGTLAPFYNVVAGTLKSPNVLANATTLVAGHFVNGPTQQDDLLLYSSSSGMAQIVAFQPGNKAEPYVPLGSFPVSTLSSVFGSTLPSTLIVTEVGANDFGGPGNFDEGCSDIFMTDGSTWGGYATGYCEFDPVNGHTGLPGSPAFIALASTGVQHSPFTSPLLPSGWPWFSAPEPYLCP